MLKYGLQAVSETFGPCEFGILFTSQQRGDFEALDCDVIQEEKHVYDTESEMREANRSFVVARFDVVGLDLSCDEAVG